MPDPSTSRFWAATAALSLGSFMIFVNVYVTHPLLPLLSQSFAISELQAGWSFSIVTLTLAASLLFYGPLSDAFGRRAIMAASMLGVTLASVLLNFAESYHQFLWMRALQGFFLAGLPAIAIAYMGDEFTKRQLITAVGFYIAANSLGGIGGRLMGGFIASITDWQEAFKVLAVMNIVILTVFWKLLPPSRNFTHRRLSVLGVIKDVASHLANRRLVLAYLIGGFNFFIFVNQYSYLTFRLSADPYLLSSAQLGMLFLTYLSGTAASMVSGRLVQHISQPIGIAIGVALMMLGTLISLNAGLWIIVLGFVVNAFGFFLSQSLSSSWVSHSATHARATASSLYLVFYYLGASIGGFYLDPFWRLAHWQGVVVASLFVLVATLFCALRLQRQYGE